MVYCYYIATQSKILSTFPDFMSILKIIKGIKVIFKNVRSSLSCYHGGIIAGLYYILSFLQYFFFSVVFVTLQLIGFFLI